MNPARAHRLDDPERKKDLPPAAIVALVQPFAGMVFADLGAGTGYCTLAVAEALGGAGRIYALEAQEEVLALLRAKLATHPYGATIEPILTPAGAAPGGGGDGGGAVARGRFYRDRTARPFSAALGVDGEKSGRLLSRPARGV